MNRVMIVVALALSAFTLGCQANRPTYNFPCTWRTADAGFCEYPSSFRLVDRLAGRY